MKPAAAWKALMKFAAAKPGAWEDHPWGETTFKVGKKGFVFFGHRDYGYSLTCKLPDSSEAATTMFSWAEPTGYGLGNSGWVTARFETSQDVPVDLLREWIDESYTAVAPKRGLKEVSPARKPAAKRRKRA